MPVFKYQHGDRPLDGYTIEHGVGRGGFGEVYYAVSDSGREVALKSVLNYEDIELRGIRQCMNLKSPHLVSIFDVRRNSRNEPFVIMEFVSGPSLRELLDETPDGLGPAKAAFFLREMAKGISYLHDCGVVHRDMKPHNVFFEDGIVKIGDYSLSKSMSASHRSGHTVTVGTVHYMAPEISMGRYGKSVDIYALGIMLYEMLTGRTPYSGSSVGEVLMKHVNGEPDLAGIAEPFASVIKKALAKDPDDRYQTADEMVAHLFGSQEIQDSVVAFNPASLSMVAERVVPKINPAPPSWEDATDEPRPVERPPYDLPPEFPTRERADEYVQAELVTYRGAGFFEHAWLTLVQFAAVVGFTTKGWRDYWGPISDPVGRLPRFIMMTIGVLIAGVGGFLYDTWGNAYVPVAIGACIIGIFVAIITQRVLLPHLERASSLLYRIVLSGAFGLAMMVWIPFCMMQSHYDELLPLVCLSPIVSMILIDWRALTSPVRRSRFSILRTFVASILAGPGAPVAAGIVVGAQLGSRFDPVASRRSCPQISLLSNLGTLLNLGFSYLTNVPIRVSKFAATTVNRVAMGAPLSKDENSPHKRFWALLLSLVPFVAGLQRLYVGRIKSGVLYILTLGLFGIGQLFDIVMIALGHFRDGAGRVVTAWNAGDIPNPVGKAVNSLSNVVSDTDWSRVRTGAGNFALNFIGGIALIVTLVLGLFLAVDIPAAIASGSLIGLELDPQEFEYAWGMRNWDQLLAKIVATFATCVALFAAGLLMVARRQKSRTHIARVPAAGFVMLGSMMFLGNGFNGGFWPKTSMVVNSEKIGPILEHFLGSNTLPIAVISLLMFGASLFILAWPEKKQQNTEKDLKLNENHSDNVVQQVG